MAYYGGHVEVHPRVYLIYWGWGEPGAFGSQTCNPEPITEGSIKVTLGCDPETAGKYMADFAQQMGGTDWAKVSTQFYQSDQLTSGTSDYIQNDKSVLAGIWTDDTNDAPTMKASNSSNPAGPTNTYTLMAQEAARAAKHFGVTGDAITDANFVIVQPPAFSDPNALASGYCAFHDYTLAGVPGNFYYDPKYVQQGISYTNMPYVTAPQLQGSCGTNLVNSDARGKFDGYSIVLGHEIEETVTDPGGEANVGSGASVSYYGGWYDATDPNENGDKCAWVGDGFNQVPGAPGNITGNTGDRFAVQSLWSNADNQGTGYCAGAGTDSPVPAAAYNNTATGGTPVSSSVPTTSGTPEVGSTLTDNNGTWSAKPSAYVYQWEDCGASGASCTQIQGATSKTYTVTAADLGDTIVVTESAANVNGTALPVASASTAAVTKAVAPTAVVTSSSGTGTTPRGTTRKGTTPTGTTPTGTKPRPRKPKPSKTKHQTKRHSRRHRSHRTRGHKRH